MALTSLLFLLAYFLGLLLCFALSPLFGLYTYIAVFYLDAPSRWWGQDLPDIRWSFIAAIATVVAALIRADSRLSWTRYGPVVVLLIYTVWMWVQSVWAITGADHLDGVVLFTKYCVVVAMILLILDSVNKICGFFIVNALGGMYLGILALSRYSGGRLNGVGGPGIDDANSLGMHLAAVTFLAGAVYLTNSRLSIRGIAAVTLPLILNTIVMAGSRGAFLAFAIGTVTLFWLRPKGQFKRTVGYGVLGLLAFLSVAGGGFWERMSTITDAVQQTDRMDKSAETRWVTLSAQMNMARDYPLGVGHRGTAALSHTYIPPEHHSAQGGRSSHNTLMSTLVDQGLPGLVLWCWILWLLYRYNKDVKRATKRVGDIDLGWLNAGVGAAIVVVIVAGLFAPFLRSEIFIWLLACQCALWRLSVATADRHSAVDTHVSGDATRRAFGISDTGYR